MRVSVVVPVFDPGRHIDALLESLRAQTLDPAEFEVVLVDDGSTDGTPDRLDALAAADPRFRVIRIPASGWPGRPRNVGIDAARGDYVFLSDHDDRLHPEALQRLVDFADEHGSDVVAGRVIGVGRSAPERIFARTVVDAQADPALLFTSLTPQKLYRRAFLQEHDIRFPEGRRRLEDHVFVTKAYLRAARVSVYADSPIYYFVLRDDGGNASRSPVVWSAYFADAAEAIAIVDAEAPDEPTRIAIRARWLRVEAIGRLRGRRFLGHRDRAGLLEATGRLLIERYPVAEVDRLGAADRLVGRLLLDGRTADVVAFAEWEASAGRVTTLESVDLGAGALRARIRVEQAAPRPLPESLQDLPAGYPDPAEFEGVVRLPAAERLDVHLHRAGHAAVGLAVEQAVVGDVLTATAVLRLGGPPVPEGRWLLRATTRGSGLPVTQALETPAPDRSAVRVGDRRYALSADRRGRLVVDVRRIGLVAVGVRIVRRVRSGVGRRLRALRKR